MKYIFLVSFFFTSYWTFAQSDSLDNKKSAISLDKVKTIYRGIANPISIAVSDCKSYEVTGLGLEEVSKGKYTLSPGQGREVIVTVKITNFDDSISVEEHTFTIANIPQMIAKIDDENCYNCIIELSKKELRNAVISVGINDFKFDMNFKSQHFQVIEFYLNSKKGKILVLGNQISEEAMKLINKLKVGEIILIDNVRVSNPRNLCRSPLNPIRIMIKE